MSLNLVSLVSDYLTSSTIGKIASEVGVDRGTAQKAIGAAVPAILAGLVSKVSKSGGADQLAKALDRQDPGLLDDLPSLIGGPAQNTLVNSGSNLLSSLLGGSATSGLASAIARYSGIGEHAIKKLLAFLAPAVMGVIGQQQEKSGLDASGLADLLKGQKNNIAAAMPAGVAQMLGTSGLLDAFAGKFSDVAGSAREAAGRTFAGFGDAAHATQRMSTGSWLPLFLALAAFGLIGWYLFGDHAQRRAETPTPPAVAVSASDVSQQVTSVVDSLKTTLGGIRDDASAKAALPTLKEAAQQLEEASDLATKLSPDSRKALATTVSALVASLTPMMDKVMAVPVASELVKPEIDAVRAKLSALALA